MSRPRLPLQILKSTPWLLGALIGLSAVTALAQGDPEKTGAPLPPLEEPCNERVRNCANMTDEELLAAASLDQNGLGNIGLGTCYFHTRATCPGCACPFYVKVSYKPGARGFDNGTGCLQTEDEVITALRMLCSSGECGCPRRALPDPGPCTQAVVWRKDPLTGTCCEYPSPCHVPTGLDDWQSFFTEEMCENG